MTSETLISIAEAVVAALAEASATGEFSEEFTPELLFNTELKVENAEELRVGIVPGKAAQVVQDRGSRECDFTIDIAVRQIIRPTDTDSITRLFSVQREIDDYLFALNAEDGRRLPGFPDAIWTASDLRWPYIPDMMRAHNQFTGINTVTYHVFDLP